MRPLPFASALLLLWASLSAGAETIIIDVDPAKSHVSFSLGATLHTVRGTIPVSGGFVRLDTSTGDANGTVVASTSKADTGNDKRDRDMHTKVLESVRFPSAEFHFERVDGRIQNGSKSSVTARGRMQLHGSAHPMNVPGTLLIKGNRAVADATFRIPYVQWGMHDPSKALIRVEKFVKVTLHLEGAVKR